MQEVQRPLHSVLASASPRWAMALLATPTFLLCSAVQPPIHKVPNRRPNDRRPARLLNSGIPEMAWVDLRYNRRLPATQ